MPEGDTAWRTANRLRDALEGQTLTSTDFRVPKFATLDLSGQVVDETVSRGKHLLIRVGPRSIHTHLKMEGVWQVHPLGGAWRRPAHQARVILQTATHEAVGFALGVTEVVDRLAEGLDHLGPDPLGPDWDLDEAARRVGSDPARPAFLALHDQRNVAGFGNEYVNELCFVSGIKPERPVADIDVTRTLERGWRMINANRNRSKRTFTGDVRSRHWVYGRDRQPCRRCGTTILRSELGNVPTQMRNTFWCPHCQP